MATISDKHNPSFILLPVNNNRTAWRAVQMPVVLVVPHRMDHSGHALANSETGNIRIYIENVPTQALVAGHQHIGMRFPDTDLYSVTLDRNELAEREIVPTSYPMTRDGVEIDPADADDGDLIHYTTTTGTRDTIPFITGAKYYDLSDVRIEVEQLPSDDYNLVYETSYFTRIIVSEGVQDDFICIDVNKPAISQYRILIKHPGDVIEEMYRLTPPVYLNNAERSLDTTVGFYRPYSDILQDIYDEQSLLEKINWVYSAPAEAIPYISALLGWDIPYYPRSLDSLRRAVLRRTVDFQNLKGSRRAVTELFRLFGFEILITNLWWSADGKRLIRPGITPPAPYSAQKIDIREECQVDALLSGWTGAEFGQFTIPLLFRPQEVAGLDDFAALKEGGNVTIDAYLVEKDSDAYNRLIEIAARIADDPSGYGVEFGFTVDANDFMLPTDIHTTMAGADIIGYSQILISGKGGKAVDEVLVGTLPPLIRASVSLDRVTNNLTLNLNGHLIAENVVFAFATYKKQALHVPNEIIDLQSNRFDIQILTEELTEFVDPKVLDFVQEFLFKIKAFHSQLNVLAYTIDLTEGYAVTDVCIGGDAQQRYDTDMGRWQVPPAIIPNIPGNLDCSKLDPRSLGYKDSDIVYRFRLLGTLPLEFEAWKALDGREIFQVTPSRLPTRRSDRNACEFTPFGQDRIINGPVPGVGLEYHPGPLANQHTINGVDDVDLSPVDEIDKGVFETTGASGCSNADSEGYGVFQREFTETRDGYCELDGQDYCYKGRVEDEILYRPMITHDELFRLKPCQLGMGSGTYYTMPSPSIRIIAGVQHPARHSRTGVNIYSGGATDTNQTPHLSSILGEYLLASYDRRLPRKLNSHLGKKYRNYDNPSETLHYTDRASELSGDQSQFLAFDRPSLDVQKSNLNHPGCRFITMHRLEANFTSSVWNAKPFDDQYSIYCGAEYRCGREPSHLNARLIADEDGYTSLEYDQTPFSILGNGQIPDIATLGDHTLNPITGIQDSDVVHKVYMSLAGGHPAISFEQVCEIDETNNTGEVAEPIFGSAISCGSLGYRDYLSGYPCEVGQFTFVDTDLDHGGLYGALFTEMEIPVEENPTDVVVIFKVGDGIKDGSTAYRLDCGCTVADCDTDGTEALSTLCGVDYFLDSDGNRDWNCDKVSIDIAAVLNEPLGGCSLILDGSIPTLLETVS